MSHKGRVGSLLGVAFVSLCFPMVLGDPCERVATPPPSKGVTNHKLRTAELVGSQRVSEK